MRTILSTLHSKFIHPSLALPCIAAFCGSECGELLIREFTIHEPRENILAAIVAEKPDVVAFSVYIWNRRETLDLIGALAKVRPLLRIVLGGPEVSFDAPEILQNHPGVAAIVRGEGEMPMRQLLGQWLKGQEPWDIPRVTRRCGDQILEGPESQPLENLDLIPSPFELGMVDLTRGFVYYESSRGCPFTCAFCMSALDNRVRSFSTSRIRRDLKLLMESRVPKIKLVDRTFNYNALRTREIISFILANNRRSHFHFEIGGHLLDEDTLALLAKVPEGMFQFEIGVQSTLDATLETIGRKVSMDKLEENVRRLREQDNIHLHLDLIAGLPGEGYDQFLSSINRVAALKPHHLQIEPVKILPGSVLRAGASKMELHFDPAPPYTILRTPDMRYAELERLRGISRLVDLLYNSGRFEGFLFGLMHISGSFASAFAELEGYWRDQGLFRHPLSQRSVFEALSTFIHALFAGDERDRLQDLLARDFASCERIVPGKAPKFFNTTVSPEEQQAIRERVQQETETIKGKGIKLQHFAARFRHLPDFAGPSLLLFLYLTRTNDGMQVKEILITV